MSEETLLTAARRIIRFVRIDDHKNGGLLSIDTIQAADTLEHQLKLEEARKACSGENNGPTKSD